MDKEYAVITGASSGIGLEFARIFASKGYNLLLIARRENRLKNICRKLEMDYNIKANYIACDLSKVFEIIQTFSEINNYNVKYFINNAGFGDSGKYSETSIKKELSMTDVNVKAVQLFTKLILQKFMLEDKGYILNVASSAGLLPAGPYMAAYYASKAFVTSYTKAIAYELKEAGSHVYIGALCPGPVDTEFNKVANVKFSMKGISAKKCAYEAYHSMKQRKVIIVPDFFTGILIKVSRLIPEKILLPILASFQKKKFYE
ncbi:hypothetical protein SAMN05216249_12719 [Acetitomaculum ruminis DSM 5522]|uniref:Ketoacyl reductase n=1 Tax=Acetitomaculum ruminis DSM 5522 TaxID=1120918 RepID=A0A1I1AH39_9FIRM|nr:SDR family oxidoreductase [Acetitomaculum ruminis]SFB37321.1 hypothetical protein SAMN05216249_12719 [Acetitomaculum ruminis DSM 5522]